MSLVSHGRSLSLVFKLLLFLVTIFASASQAEFRLATVDVNRVLNESKEAIAKRKELEGISEKAKQKIEIKRKPLQEMERKLKSKVDAENSKEAEQFRLEAKNFARFVKDTEDELKREFFRANRALTEGIIKQIRALAKDNDIQMVLDKSDRLPGPVLFGSQSADITDSIIKALNSH